jgi:DNA-binding CsgD family transcriptional regulator
MVYVKGYDEQLIQLTKWGVTAPVIAERLGISLRTVHRRRAKLGVGLGVGQPPIHERILAEAAKLIADGASHNEVARTLSIHRKTVAKYFPGTAWGLKEMSEHMSAVHIAKRLGLTDERS